MNNIVDRWLQAIDNGQVNGVVYIDLSKAFDSVDHGLLLLKLQHLGCDTNALSWFDAYLSNRVQRTVVNGVLSDRMYIDVGVPQGSILGPLLFVIFINDLASISPSIDIDMYADDTTLTTSSNTALNIESTLNREIKLISEWMKVNNLILNTNKTKFMLIGTRQRLNKMGPVSVLINEAPVERVTRYKSLGLLVDECLTWNDHVDYITRKINSKLGILKRIKPCLPLPQLQLIYKSLILPHIDYCSTVWGQRFLYHTIKLDKLQNRAARIILSAAWDTPSKELLSQLNWPTITNRFQYSKSITVFKALHNLAPSYICNKFINQGSVHNYQTRSITNNKLFIPKHRTTYMKHSLTISGSILFNSLPFIQPNSLSAFKTAAARYFKT